MGRLNVLWLVLLCFVLSLGLTAGSVAQQQDDQIAGLERLLDREAELLDLALQVRYTNLKNKTDAYLTGIEEIFTKSQIAGVQEYSPTEYNEGQNLLDDARAKYELWLQFETVTEAKFSEAKEDFELSEVLGRQASEKLEEAIQNSKDLVQKQILLTQENIALAREEGAVTHAPDILAEAEKKQREATELFRNDEFKNAMNRTLGANEEARKALDVTYQKRSELFLARMQDQIDYIISKGAREFAANQVEDLIGSVDELRQLFKNQDFKRIIDRSGDVELEYSRLVQALTDVATQNINTARERLKDAYTYKAHEFVPKEYKAASNMIEISAADRDRQEFKKSIEGAREASKLAKEAENQSIYLQILEIRPKAKREIEEADSAEAEYYAADLYSSADDNYKKSERELRSENFRVAFEAIKKSLEDAIAARMFLINDTRDILDESQNLGAMDKLRSQFIAVSEKLARARSEMNLKNYIQSASLASSARAEAMALRDRVKLMNLEEVIAGIEDSVETARVKGADSFLPDETETIETDIREVMEKYGVPKYDQAMIGLKELKIKADGLPDKIMKKRDKWVKDIQEGIDTAVDNGAEIYARELLEQTRQYLSFGNVDFHKGEENQKLYKTSAEYYQGAEDNIKALEIRKLEYDYQVMLEEVLDRLVANIEGFRNVIEGGPDLILVSKPGKYSDTYKTFQWDIDTEAFYRHLNDVTKAAEEIEPPSSLKDYHKDVVIPMFLEAREASLYFKRFGEYERFLPDARKQMLLEAFDKMKWVEQRHAEISEDILGYLAEPTAGTGRYKWAMEGQKKKESTKHLR